MTDNSVREVRVVRVSEEWLVEREIGQNGVFLVLSEKLQLASSFSCLLLLGGARGQGAAGNHTQEGADGMAAVEPAIQHF